MEIQNKHQALSDPNTKDADMDIELTEDHSKEVNEAINKPKGKPLPLPINRDRGKKVPPILIQGRNFNQAIMAQMRRATKEEIIKEHKTNSTMVFAKNIDDFRAMKKVLSMNTTPTPQDTCIHPKRIRPISRPRRYNGSTRKRTPYPSLKSVQIRYKEYNVHGCNNK
ncbi:hypothetical protein JTB14_033320 [Gonioctena quinquepunctata]|nr:hypothetical protein JTB14_033320 [Gonioctena quinquepunctata]